MLSLTETHEYDGYWWLPGTAPSGSLPEPSGRVSGRLVIVEGRAELSVLGHFGHKVLGESETTTTYSPFPSNVARVLGLTSTGKPVTLEHCVVTDSSMRFPGIATTTYRAGVALLGAWFDEEEEVRFDEIALRISELDTWTGVSGLRQSITGSEEGERSAFVPSAIDIRFEPPAPVTIPLDNGEEARIDFGFTVSGWDPVPVEARLTQTASLYFRFAEPRKVELVPGTVAQLRNFLCLAVGRPVTLLSASGYIDEYRHPNTNTREPVDLLWQIPHNPKPRSRKLHPTEMLFLLSDAEPDISTVMRAWFARQELLEPVLDLYFSVLYHPDLFAEVRFLLYAQALETYDFRRRDPHELSEEDHNSRISAILAGAPEEWLEWLRTRLLSSNYRTLDQRIRDVLAECSPVSARIVGSTDDEVDAFVRAVKNTRNYYTHYTPSLEGRAKTDPTERHLLTLQLRAIIEMSLLRELGFSCEAIDHILDRVQRYAEIQHFKAAVRDE